MVPPACTATRCSATTGRIKQEILGLLGGLELCFVNVGRWLGTGSQPSMARKETEQGIELVCRKH